MYTHTHPNLFWPTAISVNTEKYDIYIYFGNEKIQMHLQMECCFTILQMKNKVFDNNHQVF